MMDTWITLMMSQNLAELREIVLALLVAAALGFSLCVIYVWTTVLIQLSHVLPDLHEWVKRHNAIDNRVPEPKVELAPPLRNRVAP